MIVIQDQSGKEYKMDDLQVRFPTNVEDVARVLYDLTRMLLTPSSSFGSSLIITELSDLPPILHYSTPAPPLTKYQMTQIIGKHLNLPTHHVKPNTEPPTGAAATQRPENSQLSSNKLKEIGVDVGEAQAFESWWKECCVELKSKAEDA